jgi:hypothetical protein
MGGVDATIDYKRKFQQGGAAVYSGQLIMAFLYAWRKDEQCFEIRLNYEKSRCRLEQKGAGCEGSKIIFLHEVSFDDLGNF